MIRLFNEEIKKQISDEITVALLKELEGIVFEHEYAYLAWAEKIDRIYKDRLTDDDYYYICDVACDKIKEL